MIQNIRIKNFVLIDDLDIDFQTGFNVLIGETGAGKSILVNALSLLTGSRSQFDKLNDDTKKAIIEATFVLRPEFIAEHEYLNDYLDENTLTVSRALLPSKATQIRINGEVVTLSELKKVMTDIVEITSQGEQSALMEPLQQLKIVDKFLIRQEGNELLDHYKQSYDSYLLAQKKKDDFILASRANDVDVIQFKLEEISKKKIVDNEIETIERILEESEKSADLAASGKELEALYNSEEYESFAATLTHSLNCLHNPIVQDKSAKARATWDELTEEIYDLVSSCSSDELDEEQIATYNERLYELTPLMKKYGNKTADILQVQKELENRLDEVTNYEKILQEKEDEVRETSAKARSIAEELSVARKKCAAEISRSVNDHLRSLGLREDGFKIEFSKNDLGNSGQDEIHFKVGLNKGHAFEELSVAASGGEKSRLMLALIASFNSVSRADTLIFDEVDTGVSGNIALIVGKKIKEISRNSTILAISHLPPVVSAADHTYLVYKYDREEKTISTIRELSREDSVAELAKMIGGSVNMAEATDLAKKMIKEQNN